MPAPRPSITPSVGAKVGKSVKRVPNVEQHQPARERDPGGEQREEHRRGRAEHEREDDDRHRDADELADRRLLLLGLVDDLAAADVSMPARS